jgi:hypothetical protein
MGLQQLLPCEEVDVFHSLLPAKMYEAQTPSLPASYDG